MVPPNDIQTHHLEALGWTLIHFCWQAATLAILYKAVDFSFSGERLLHKRKPTSHARYLFALTTMLAMFAAATGTLLYEEVRLAKTSPITYATDPGTNKIQPADNTFPSTLLPTDSPATTTLRANIAAALPDPATILPWLDALWMLGVLALSARTLGGWLLIQRLRSTATQQVPPQLTAAFHRLAHSIGVKGQVALRLSTRIASPLTVGMFRSLILLPASALTTLTPGQLEAVLAHELAHIRRADYLWNILQTMIETLFFFHPAVWWVGASLRQQRELCCDDIAIASCSDPVTYATALLLLEEQRNHALTLRTPSTEFPLALALDGHQPRFTLRSRIARILGDDEGASMQPAASPRNIAPFSILGVCGALALFLLPLPQVLASLRPVPAQNAAPAAALPDTPTSPEAAPEQNTHARIVPVAVVHPPNQPAPPPAPAPAPSAATPHNLTVVAPLAPAALIEPRPYMAMLIQPAPIASPAPKAMPAPRPAPAPRAYASNSYAYSSNGSNYNVNVDVDLAEVSNSISKSIAISKSAIARNAMSQAAAASVKSSTYIEDMRAAGYDGDIDQFIALKTQNITPEFARSMNSLGLGKPNLAELIALKIHGVTPEYVAQLKAAGIQPEKFQDLVSYRIFNVSPEYIAGMKAAGFGDIPAKKLIELRTQNVTPEFARSTKAAFPDATVNDLTQLRIFAIDDTFINAAKNMASLHSPSLSSSSSASPASSTTKLPPLQFAIETAPNARSSVMRPTSSASSNATKSAKPATVPATQPKPSEIASVISPTPKGTVNAT